MHVYTRVPAPPRLLPIAAAAAASAAVTRTAGVLTAGEYVVYDHLRQPHVVGWRGIVISFSLCCAYTRALLQARC